MSRIATSAVPVVLLCALSSVSILPGCGISPYRLEIQQGNVITQEMLDKLRPAMTRAQVRFVMGTPLVADSFHPERWDYFYEFDRAGNATERRRLTLIFEDDRLARVIGDVQVAPELVAPQPEGGSRAATESNAKEQ